MIKKIILLFLVLSYSVFGVHAYMRTAAAAGDLSKSVASNKFDVVGVAEDFRDGTAHREALSQMTPEEVAVMNNPEAFDTESVQYVAAKYTAVYAEMKGINAADIKLFDDAKLENEQGKNVKASDTTAFSTDGAIYLEADKIQENGNLIHAMGHENKRQDQIQKGVKNETKDGVSTVADKEAYAAGKHAKKAFELEKRIKKPQSYEKTTYVRSKADNDAIAQGSKQASQVENVQPYIDWKNKDGVEIVFSNKKVKAEWQKGNDIIIEQTGIKDEDFRLQASGGDRYIGADGLHYSRTLGTVVPNSHITSPHLEERGARGIDFTIKGVTIEQVKNAMDQTAFKDGDWSTNYKPENAHVHTSLKNLPKNHAKNNK